MLLSCVLFLVLIACCIFSGLPVLRGRMAWVVLALLVPGLICLLPLSVWLFPQESDPLPIEMRVAAWSLLGLAALLSRLAARPWGSSSCAGDPVSPGGPPVSSASPVAPRMSRPAVKAPPRPSLSSSTPVQPSLSPSVLPSSAPQPEPMTEPLTRRELEVACLVQAGMKNLEISARLNIAESTLRVHLRSIYRKLRLQGRPRSSLASIPLPLSLATPSLAATRALPEGSGWGRCARPQTPAAGESPLHSLAQPPYHIGG